MWAVLASCSVCPVHELRTAHRTAPTLAHTAHHTLARYCASYASSVLYIGQRHTLVQYREPHASPVPRIGHSSVPRINQQSTAPHVSAVPKHPVQREVHTGCSIVALTSFFEKTALISTNRVACSTSLRAEACVFTASSEVGWRSPSLEIKSWGWVAQHTGHRVARAEGHRPLILHIVKLLVSVPDIAHHMRRTIGGMLPRPSETPALLPATESRPLGPGSRPYARSVPDIAQHARRQIAPYVRSVPDIAQHACRQTAALTSSPTATASLSLFSCPPSRPPFAGCDLTAAIASCSRRRRGSIKFSASDQPGHEKRPRRSAAEFAGESAYFAHAMHVMRKGMAPAPASHCLLSPPPAHRSPCVCQSSRLHTEGFIKSATATKKIGHELPPRISLSRPPAPCCTLPHALLTGAGRLGSSSSLSLRSASNFPSLH
eukprot:1219605-Rhodomonas_salina.1